MNDWYLQALVLWPLVVLVSALANMLISASFSWSELVLDYFVGLALGLAFHAGTQPGAGAVDSFLLVFSHGLYGLLYRQGAFADAQTFFWVTALATVLGTAVTALTDRLSASLGRSPSVLGMLLSTLVWPIKAPFALITGGVSMAMWLVGAIRAAAAPHGKVGFLGGVFYVEWKTDAAGAQATTLGSVVQIWSGRFAALFDHELYHSRQYIYMRDWLIPFWLLGGIWGLLSSAAAGSFNLRAYMAAKSTREVGNPLERAAYRISGFDPF